MKVPFYLRTSKELPAAHVAGLYKPPAAARGAQNQHTLSPQRNPCPSSPGRLFFLGSCYLHKFLRRKACVCQWLSSMEALVRPLLFSGPRCYGTSAGSVCQWRQRCGYQRWRCPNRPSRISVAHRPSQRCVRSCGYRLGAYSCLPCQQVPTAIWSSGVVFIRLKSEVNITKLLPVMHAEIATLCGFADPAFVKATLHSF